ncbi:bifunctional pyr operon transcriptional regulator/uracil phosphoribosyltransferase PyrR [Thiomicrorhabdus xiamenensis]|uniref:Bifunctional pyr operon transcriptional regulator/uracil phosphoribosyltransferase PyrR n=1 Tax=Thiomicrorhabdus xiamenensis TaxID=2739063 RepID=A0A7D4NJP8_9GAMM|nr:bifunctional pyr operon transcriptional regulator/uracil phosphoribosyltransferase PyrR [Thiomicrorhabdus xiamenensis]QKI88509.1 bifunctional pyr operon transcriptional regulator/uracil phosphoribosyltransferase PyrR [Thiomicrorhabdus xiamenensis]
MQELDIDVNALIDKMTAELKPLLIKYPGAKMIGIRTGGEWIAQSLHRQLELTDELGVIDISFYRDDFSKIGLNPTIKPSHIPWDVEDQHLILVDDVLFTGRTVRSALNEIFDFGRPASVTLVTLLDRKGCRELPLQADIVGMPLKCEQTLKLTGPEPLKIMISEPSEVSA